MDEEEAPQVWVMAMTEATDVGTLMRWGIEGEGDDPFSLYLSAFNVDGARGRGLIRTTSDVGWALRFPSFAAVMELWQRQSTVRPLRDDGKPNRPLTAWTIEPRRIA
jgi:hypothetical protein